VAGSSNHIEIGSQHSSFRIPLANKLPHGGFHMTIAQHKANATLFQLNFCGTKGYLSKIII